jgi:osmotically-inducible protein OsmY
VQHDTVTLRGVVRSAAERDLVLGAVTGPRGVKQIDNQIRIDPHGR